MSYLYLEVQLTPFVLSAVFRFVGYDSDDFLNCQLVCKQWFFVIANIMKSSNHPLYDLLEIYANQTQVNSLPNDAIFIVVDHKYRSPSLYFTPKSNIIQKLIKTFLYS